MKHPLILAFLLLIKGCQVQTDDLQQFVDETQQTTQVSIEPYPEFTAHPPFIYAAQDQRSPFNRPKNLVLQPISRPQSNCLQPDTSRDKEALERYGIDALKVTGFFTSKNKPWVLFIANDGSLHKATIGNHLGLFFGKITAIDNNIITITELLPDGAGCWQQKQTTLSMSTAAEEQDNV